MFETNRIFVAPQNGAMKGEPSSNRSGGDLVDFAHDFLDWGSRSWQMTKQFMYVLVDAWTNYITALRFLTRKLTK